MLNINHNYKGHLWCGIGALSAATKTPTSICRNVIKAVSLRKQIKAVTYSEMAHALTAMGYRIEREFYRRDPDACPTLKDWLHSKYRKFDEVSVVCITGHWIVIQNDQWVCSMNQKPRHVDDCPYLRARVRHVVKFHTHTSSGS